MKGIFWVVFFSDLCIELTLSNFSTSPIMSKTQTLLRKYSLPFCLITSGNSAYLSKWHNCKPNKCFILSLSQDCKNIRFPLTGGS